MSSLADDPVDLIRELQLRQWARRNYVAPELRRANWDPIVLSEMALRDRERRELPSDWTPQRTPFVPLAPTDFTYLDQAHSIPPAPGGLLSPRETVRVEAEIYCGDDEEEERIAGF